VQRNVKTPRRDAIREFISSEAFIIFNPVVLELLEAVPEIRWQIYAKDKK
jgi:hypothetical protein